MTPPAPTARPATPDDLSALADLWQRFEVATRGFTESDEAAVRADWEAPGFDLSRDTLVLDDGGRLVGYALVDGEHADTVADPERPGEGLEDALLDWVEGRSTSLQHYWGAGDPAAEERFRRRGWSPARTYWRMRLDLDGPQPEPVWPAGVAVRELDPDRDGRAVHALVRAAFAEIGDGSGQAPYDEWAAARFGERYDAELTLVVEDGGEPVAASLGEVLPESAFVRQLAVAAAQRGRGLALALLRETARRAAARGLPALVLGVDAGNPTGALRLYETAGMQVVEEFTRWER